MKWKTAGRAAVITLAAVAALTAGVSLFGQESRPGAAAGKAVTRDIIPTAEITPGSFTFPGTRVGQTSASQTFTVTKKGSILPLYIFSTHLSDSNNFHITSDGCSGSVLFGSQSCEIQVEFDPGEKAHFGNTLSVINLGKDVIATASVDGTGTLPAVTLSDTSLRFGHQTVGTPSAPQPVTLTNSGDAVLNIGGITPSGDFAVTDTCGATLDPGDSCSLDVTFTPSSAGDKTGTVTITDDASDSPQTIALSGTGIPPGSPDVSLSATTVNFGNQPAGSTSGARSVVVTNVGAATLNIAGIHASGSFAATSGCGATLNPGQSCTINVTFSPPSAGSFSGTLTLSDNATDSPQTVDLMGSGIIPDTPYAVLSATTVDFGDQVLHTPSDPVTVTLTNVGTSDLTSEKSVIAGDHYHSFSRVDRCAGSSLGYNESCDISVTFTPVLHGDLVGVLQVVNDASDSPQIVLLTGRGVFPRGVYFTTQSAVFPGDTLVVNWTITDVNQYVTAYFGAITPRGNLYTVDSRRAWREGVTPIVKWFNPGGDRSGTLYLEVPENAPPGEYALGAALSAGGQLIEPGAVFQDLTVQ